MPPPSRTPGKRLSDERYRISDAVGNKGHVDDCKGNAPTATLIVCLQPDRRVEVEVSGTR